MTWAELEQRFAELRAGLRFTRLDYQWGDAGIHYRLAVGADKSAQARFRAIASLAGKKLPSSVRSAPADLGNSDEHEWYEALKSRSGLFRTEIAGEITRDGQPAGFVYSGSVQEPVEASIVLCLQMAAVDGDLPSAVVPRRSRVAIVVEHPVISGVLATIIGGLLLALCS